MSLPHLIAPGESEPLELKRSTAESKSLARPGTSHHGTEGIPIHRARFHLETLGGPAVSREGRAQLRTLGSSARCKRDAPDGDQRQILGGESLAYSLEHSPPVAWREYAPFIFEGKPLPARVIFHRTGLIEKWDRGTNRVAEMCEAAGIAPPDFKELTGGAVVTFRVPVSTLPSTGKSPHQSMRS